MNDTDFSINVAVQENESLYLRDGSKLILKNQSPEDGDNYDIAFGHKITLDEQKSGLIYGIPYTKGITKQQALYILGKDISLHTERARNNVGYLKFDSLPKPAQQILTDLSFTGSLSQFPRLKMSMFDKNKDGVLKNYKRYFTLNGVRVEMKRRNEFILRLINELEGVGYFE